MIGLSMIVKKEKSLRNQINIRSKFQTYSPTCYWDTFIGVLLRGNSFWDRNGLFKTNPMRLCFLPLVYFQTSNVAQQQQQISSYSFFVCARVWVRYGLYKIRSTHCRSSICDDPLFICAQKRSKDIHVIT